MALGAVAKTLPQPGPQMAVDLLQGAADQRGRAGHADLVLALVPSGGHGSATFHELVQEFHDRLRGRVREKAGGMRSRRPA
ncbi:hypothetical protein GCM10010398_60770 [Streptomyces fimbriatus]